MSGSEVLIYAYGAVCLSMIMFNMIYNIVLRKKEPETTMKAQKIKEALLKKYSADSDTGTTGWETSRVQAFLKEEDLELGKSEDLLTFSEAVSLLAEEGLEEAAEGMIRVRQRASGKSFKICSPGKHVLPYQCAGCFICFWERGICGESSRKAR